MKSDHDLLLEMRQELIELTQLVIQIGSQVQELQAIERAKNSIEIAKFGKSNKNNNVED